MNSEASAPFDFQRFIAAQNEVYDTALRELRRGRKQSHWMWFIFPQLAGLGSSPMAQRYAIQNIDEAHAYLRHEILGPRLIACCRALLSVGGKSASDIMGYPDDLKLRSSVTLFNLVSDEATEFRDLLEKYFGGKPDEKTLELLKK
jgi:uncharacterized protein (DUF1810 family)